MFQGHLKSTFSAGVKWPPFLISDHKTQEEELYDTTYDDYGEEEEEENDERPRLYVGDLQGDITKEMLMEVFGPYGDVIDIWIARDPKGVPFFI